MYIYSILPVCYTPIAIKLKLMAIKSNEFFIYHSFLSPPQPPILTVEDAWLPLPIFSNECKSTQMKRWLIFYLIPKNYVCLSLFIRFYIKNWRGEGVRGLYVCHHKGKKKLISLFIRFYLKKWRGRGEEIAARGTRLCCASAKYELVKV